MSNVNNSDLKELPQGGSFFILTTMQSIRVCIEG